MSKSLFWVVLAVVAAAVIAYVALTMNKPGTTPEDGAGTGEEEGVFCTMDAKICPDGSSVGRVAPSCNFAPCPGEVVAE